MDFDPKRTVPYFILFGLAHAVAISCIPRDGLKSQFSFSGVACHNFRSQQLEGASVIRGSDDGLKLPEKKCPVATGVWFAHNRWIHWKMPWQAAFLESSCSPAYNSRYRGVWPVSSQARLGVLVQARLNKHLDQSQIAQIHTYVRILV